MKGELLAPAGSFESLRTALHFGADAVYCGGPLLQLRAESAGFGFDELPKADCVIVAVGHKQYRSMSMRQLKALFREDRKDPEKVLIDVKSLYRMDELKASGMRFWRL